MTEIKTNSELMNNYGDYYSHSETEWRELCAKRKAENIIDLCSGKKFARVVEIGAGEGSILQNLANNDFSEGLYALEISESGIENIRKRNIPQMKDVVLFDGYNSTYPDCFFDLAILSHVVEHVEHPRILLYEARRIAKKVFVEVPLEDNFSLKADFVFDRVGHINHYNPKTIRFLMQSSGFEIIKQKVSNPSKEIFEFQAGFKGSIKYFIKEIALKVFPNLSPKVFTYQSSILSKGKENLYI